MIAEQGITLLLADDDEEDRQLAKEALDEHRLANDLHFVADGRELLDYLRREGAYADPAVAPRPGLILLDLNMPRLNGRQALQLIKSDPELRTIPVVVLTTSREEEDIVRSYDLGANSFITKPVMFESLVKIMKDLSTYWFEIVELPAEK